MEAPVPGCTLPDLAAVRTPAELAAMRLVALHALVSDLDEHLTGAPYLAPTALEDLSLRHLAKATGSIQAALLLLGAGRWADACVLTRAVFEQLFTYLWIVEDPDKADARGVMVTLKQEWANAQYLAGMADNAPPEAQAPLRAEAARYRAIAESLLTRLAADLGVSEKVVRTEAIKRVSLKAIEVNLGPPFSVPYAYYSGFVHSDGVALEAYAATTDGSVAYTTRGDARPNLPLAADMHRALLRLTDEAWPRCPQLMARDDGAFLGQQRAWLETADKKEASLRVNSL